MKEARYLLNLALEAAQDAAHYVITHWHDHTASIKSDGSIVTSVDIATEKIIRNKLHEGAPDIAILGEELGHSYNTKPKKYWLVDPIDGTRWYHLGIPVFGTLIALIVDDEPVIGVIAIPPTQEFLYASLGSGCYYFHQNCKPKKVVVNNTKSIRDAVVSASGAHGSDIWLENGTKPYQLSKVFQLCKAFFFTGDCIQHFLVAKGRLDIAIDTIMKPWDSAAIIPCIREAGGYVCGIDGKADNLLHCGTLLSSASKELATQLIDILQPESP